MVEVEEIELDLGLSIGGAFRKKPVEKPKPESGQNQSNVMQKVDQNQNQQSTVKHEFHALKRKREEKKGTGDRVRDVDAEPESEPVFKKEKTEVVERGGSWMAPFRVVQPQQYGNVKLVPFSNGMNGMLLPRWFGGEKNVGGVDGVSTVNGGNGKVKSNGSSSRCSSVVSDYQSSSREDGGSNDSNSQHSANSLTQQTQLKNSKEISFRRNQHEQIVSSKQSNIVKETQIHPSIKKMPSNPMKPNEDSTTSATPTISIPIKKSLTQMPYVSAKGNGPNGRTVNGFLYRYSKCDEVSIVCVCHGSTFSPAEFVQHAGGTDISHPLRHITVNSSAFP